MTKTPANESEGTQFIVDLGRIELTDDEVNTVQNQITRVALEFARKNKESAAKGKRKEPYVKILHVKTTHVRTIKR